VKHTLSLCLVLSAGAVMAENRTAFLSPSDRAAIFDVAGTFTFSVPDNMIGTANVLVVGGGGGGGGISGGGGGGGQIVLTESVAMSPGENWSVTVAAGGAGGNGNAKGGNGGTAVLYRTESSVSISAVGGGGGGGGWGSTSGLSGANGGGGGGNGTTVLEGGEPTVPDGHRGGSTDGVGNLTRYGGGGGGAAQDGKTITEGSGGGTGVVYSISGQAVMYASGGGGGRNGSIGVGGSGDGSGNGWSSASLPGTPGCDGKGGGGGGGRPGDGAAKGWPGGTGTVIVRYSVDTSKIALSVKAEGNRGIIPFAASFVATVDNPSGSPASLRWDFGDGTPILETSAVSVSHVYSTSGSYDVSVMVSAAGLVTEKKYEDLVFAADRNIYADAHGSNPVAPYRTPETAATNLADAVAAVSMPGQIVRVASGDYPISLPIQIAYPMAVEGAGSTPADVVVRMTAVNQWYADEASRRRRIFVLDNPYARISNLTVSNGWDRMQGSPSAGGVVVTSNGGTVSNCVITRCVNSRCTVGAGGADLAGGLITHTIIENCETEPTQYSKQIGGGSALRLTGAARAENCLIRNCDTGSLSIGYHTVLLDSSGAKAVNLSIVSCNAKSFQYGDGTPVTTQSYGLYVNAGEAVNCVVADERNRTTDENRAWAGSASKFVNCATDTLEPINATCLAITTAAFRDFEAGKLVPRPGGLLSDTGADVSGWSAALCDLAGQKRILGSHIDIGCFEGSPLGLTILLR
jgi:hypothetical protein